MQQVSQFRKICRIPTGLGTGNQADTQTTENPQPQLRRADKLEEWHPTFGPLYTINKPAVQAIKDSAWDHVMKMANNKSLLSTTVQEKDQVRDNYTRVIRRIQDEAKETYTNVGVSSDDFRLMMIKDGCFFLQLALLILGCTSEQLGYNSENPILFDIKNKMWIEAMLCTGNQIPFVVLRELMSQAFFRRMIEPIKWDTVPHSLLGRVLYEVLGLPVLNKHHSRFHRDILHALQDMVIGPDHSPCVLIAPHDLEEANEEETGIDDEEDFDDDDDSNHGGYVRIRRVLTALRISKSVNRKRVFRSATELERAGIRVTRLESSIGGSRSISFQSYYIWAYLYLPVFPVDDNTETVLRSLKTYQACHQRREVSSYVRLMSDMIQTRKDAILMKKRGIIQGNPDVDENMLEKLPATLRRLSSEDVRLTPELRALKRRIMDYSSPWVHYKGVVSLVAFLALLQTFFALLAYFSPPKPFLPVYTPPPPPQY